MMRNADPVLDAPGAPVKMLRASHLPVRFATGLFILNSGLTKRSAPPEAAVGIHGFATGTYPFLSALEAEKFVKYLSTSEIVLGSALLIPLVPSALVGAGLAAFSAGLLGLYVRTPGMRREGSLRPTEQGNGIAKDIWMLAIALSLISDSLNDRD